MLHEMKKNSNKIKYVLDEYILDIYIIYFVCTTLNKWQNANYLQIKNILLTKRGIWGHKYVNNNKNSKMLQELIFILML